MPVVNRESVSPLHSVDIDSTHPEVAVSPRASQVESFDPSKSSPMQQQGSTVGSVSARGVGQLDAKAVTEQVKELMSGWRVSSDDCQHAVGLLQSLPPAEYCRALKLLSASGALRALCESSPADLRRELAESAVHGGATTVSPERLSRGLRDPQPPAQPALIVNSPSLPRELREVIHGENQGRAKQYQADFNAYADAWCAKVANCKSPLELRQLGPLSNPPALLEPGICDADFAAKRFVSLHCQANLGVERAAKAVSNQVSVFRKELQAGGFSLDFQVKGQITFEGEGPGHTEGAVGTAFTTKTSLTQDGRVLKQRVEAESVVKAMGGPLELEGKFDSKGHLAAVEGEVAGVGVELERDGKVTFQVPVFAVAPGVGQGVALETFVDANGAEYGAAIVAKEKGERFGATIEIEAKLGFTAKGIDRSYYADIGGTQQGFFGPMPELDGGVAWDDLKKDRREWYQRQGFTKSSWP